MLEEKLEQDIKTALLAGDTRLATTLRGLKAVLLNVKVATGKRESGLEDDIVIDVFSKEAKKRQDSADLYRQGGSEERAQAELNEKKIIEAYLPPKLSEEDIAKEVDNVISESGINNLAEMGKVIGQVKSKLGPSADGSVIARIVKDKLQ